MKILIIGGTSFLGPAVVEAALARNHEVILFNRGKTNPHLFPDLKKIKGDRTKDLQLLEGKEFDVVVDTCGYFPKDVRNAANALRDSVTQYIFISSISALNGHAKVGADETSETMSLSDENLGRVDELGWKEMREEMSLYGALKALCENAAEIAMPGRVTNIRPGLIVGPRDRTGRYHYWPWRVNRGGRMLAPEPRDGAVQFIDVRDLGEFVVTTIDDGHVGIFHATGPAGGGTMSDLLESCQSVVKEPATLEWVDGDFLVERKLSTWSLPLWIPASDSESQGLQRVDISKALAHGMKTRPWPETAAATLEDIRKNGLDETWPQGEEMVKKEAEILAAWDERSA